jgi:transposase-like protein
MARRNNKKPYFLTDDQAQAVRAAMSAGATIAEAARGVGIDPRRLRIRLLDQLADIPKRGRGHGGRRGAAVDPDPETIAKRAAEIRARWTDEVFQERRMKFNG